MRLRTIPPRLAAGAFVAHSGLEKWKGTEERAQAIHGFASAAYPQFKTMPPTQFLRMLSVGEIAVGTALLAPFVPTALAGAALAGFSGGLLGLYWRVPGLRKPGSIWPSEQGLPVSKDVWMFGIALGLIIDGLGDG